MSGQAEQLQQSVAFFNLGGDVGESCAAAGGWLAGWLAGGRLGGRLTAGGLCLLLGTLGIVVPLLQTVDFYVMAAVCFGRGSRRWAQWLLNQPHIGSCGDSLFAMPQLSKLSHACGSCWEIPTGP